MKWTRLPRERRELRAKLLTRQVRAGLRECRCDGALYDDGDMWIRCHMCGRSTGVPSDAARRWKL